MCSQFEQLRLDFNKTHQLLSQFHRTSETRANLSVSRLPSGYFKRCVQFTEPPGSSSALLAVKVNVILHNDGCAALRITRRDVSILQSASQLKLKHLQSGESFYQRNKSQEGSQRLKEDKHSGCYSVISSLMKLKTTISNLKKISGCQ